MVSKGLLGIATKGKIMARENDNVENEKRPGMRYVVGIDLGTTNTEAAYWPLNDRTASPTILEIPQFVEQAVIEKRATLPSALYIGAAEEKESADWRLPGEPNENGATDAKAGPEKSKTDKSGGKGKRGFFKKLFGVGGESRESGVTNSDALYLVGEIASRRAAESPDKVVLSAKSWLAYTKVDRHSPILPSDATDDMPKVSPVEASRRYLARIVETWNDAFPDAPIFEQLVVLTVPASFDESARELTREAAYAAGINPETMLFLEEPQAALYAWLARQGDAWRDKLKVGDVILVCDVGGGTTDLSLIKVQEEDGDLALERLAVGDRLLLGGDNIDLALAMRAAELFAEKDVELNPWQSGALQRQCRRAKEELLADGSNEDASCRITIAGRSSRLVGESLAIDFPCRDALDITLDGFFPFCELTDRPQRRSHFGLREKGLPYEADPAITKHVAAFLGDRLALASESGAPTTFLLNGGLFKSSVVANRMQEQFARWFPEKLPKNLDQNADMESSVALGAAYYGATKLSGGVRIRAASARSYYIGIESAGMAIPGVARPMKALCVAPTGMEEGEELDVPSEAFELVVGEPAKFRFFTSVSRPQDEPGVLLTYYDDERTRAIKRDSVELEETDPIETTLDSFDDESEDADSAKPSQPEFVMVRFHTKMTELGALEIWCEEVDGERRWKLEFSVRE